jgi:hypothetical protein
VNYGGGSEFFYHLRIGEFALATTVFPTVAEQGTKQLFRLAGPDGEVGVVEATASANSQTLPFATHGVNGSASVRALVSTKPEIIEREPNDIPAKATKISLGNGINGRFDKRDDVDFYEFHAQQGERWEFRAATRSLGSPSDAMLEIVGAKDTLLARSNPSGADEGLVSHKFTEAGIFYLAVREASGAFGPNCVYHITAQRAAGFTLSVDTDRVNAAPGQSFDLRVTCARGDYKGKVTLSLQGIESLAVTNNVIMEGKTNTTLKVFVPERFTAPVPCFFSVFGTATRDKVELQTQASTAPALRQRFPQMLYPPAEFDGVIALGIVR